MKGFMYEAYELLTENVDNKTLKETIVNLAKTCGYRNSWLLGESDKIYIHHINLDKVNKLNNLCIMPQNYHKSLHSRIPNNVSKTEQKRIANEILMTMVSNGKALLFSDLIRKFITKVDKAAE